MAEVIQRDLDLYLDWTRGARKIALARKYDLNRDTVAAVIDRFKPEMPTQDRVHTFDQSLEMIEDLLAVYQPMALAQDKAAGRLVDRLLGRRNEMLGLDSPAKLELFRAEHQAQVQHVDVKTELAALLAKIRNGDRHA
jgi:hypothetical protein